ncbi:MAG TPA: hydantoinase/oxoprolinase family protein [Gaiellaceae bacterium]|nr:hydantoinase/oxoprolinase family protein [Gaiellaceae bacterium]
MSYRVGVDIGGTFTDLVVTREDGSTLLWKEETTPDRPERAVQTGLERVAELLEHDLGSFLSNVTLLVHGSTVATNMVVQRSGSTVGLVCTRGFRDILYFRDGFKWDRFNPRLPRPDDLVPRRRRVAVAERTSAHGSVLQPLDEGSVRRAAATLKQEGVDAVAVALLWAHANPAHEQGVRELLRQELPGVPVLLSSEVLPELGEWVRSSATVLSAFVYAGSRDYLEQLQQWLSTRGLRTGLLVMQVNGGCASVEQTLRVPVSTIHSGPAAAPAAALQVGKRAAARDMITIDMGGTSFDVCLIGDGEVPRSRTIEIQHQPIGIPGVEIHSIGAGGGSLAWIDTGGALRVGPQSAGARPGPAAYGQGGERPTVTDANVVLGYLSPDAFLGGRRQLRSDLAADAIRQHVAEPLGVELVAAAAGMIRVINQNMVDAIGVVSVERGIDPRPFLLVAGGGAGALHAGRLAAELGITRVLVPAEAGTLSAFGMTVSNVRHDYAAAHHATSLDPQREAVNALLGKLERRARVDLVQNGFSAVDVVVQRFVDARYVGQVHELTVPVPPGPLGREELDAIVGAFHRLHEERYGWSAQDRGVEYLHWRVTGTGLIRTPVEPLIDELAPTPADAAATGSRPAWFDELGGFVETATYAADRFAAGGEVHGPALVDGATMTIVVFPGQRLLADGRGSFLLETPTP